MRVHSAHGTPFNTSFSAFASTQADTLVLEDLLAINQRMAQLQATHQLIESQVRQLGV